MTTSFAGGVDAPSLRGMLSSIDSPWAPLANGQASWSDLQNEAMADIIDRFDDCPEALKDFDHSDWVNLAECYTRQLVDRWDQQSESIKIGRAHV